LSTLTDVVLWMGQYIQTKMELTNCGERK